MKKESEVGKRGEGEREGETWRL
uniref:Uncharacterized protein n=1 Tax=Anguilla anguilla TaxID=7936 RepID=A0A0E9Q402_ANGAN